MTGGYGLTAAQARLAIAAMVALDAADNPKVAALPRAERRRIEQATRRDVRRARRAVTRESASV